MKAAPAFLFYRIHRFLKVLFSPLLLLAAVEEIVS